MQAGAKAYIEMDQQLNRPVSQQKKVCSSVVCVCLICDNVMPITPGINHNPACGSAEQAESKKGLQFVIHLSAHNGNRSRCHVIFMIHQRSK